MKINGSKPGEVNYSSQISNGILHPKHTSRIGGAIWCFFWFIDKTTDEEDGIGKVLGGKPVTHTQIALDLGFSKRRVERDCKRLKDEKYIEVIRTPHGLQVCVAKSKKFPSKRFAKMVNQNGSDSPNLVNREGSDSPKMVPPPTKNGESIYRPSSDLTVEAAATAFSPPSEEWTTLGLSTRIGTAKFQEVWTSFYSNRNGHQLSEVMELAIQQAQDKGINVPRPFYQAKRRVETQEDEKPSNVDSGMDLPRLKVDQ